MEKSGVRHLSDLFELKVMDILRLDGFAEKSAANLIEEIRKARVVNDYQLLAALNIPNIGVNVAKVIFEHCDFARLRTMTAEELGAIPGIGPERARALVSELAAQSDYLDELLGALQVVHATSAAGRPTVCFTGKMPEKRSWYEKLATANGYTPVDDVTSSLSLLVAADVNATGGKLTKAAKLGIRVLPLEEFLASLRPAADAGTEVSQPTLF